MSGSETLFTAALGLSWPWQVTDIRRVDGFVQGLQGRRGEASAAGAAVLRSLSCHQAGQPSARSRPPERGQEPACAQRQALGYAQGSSPLEPGPDRRHARADALEPEDRARLAAQEALRAIFETAKDGIDPEPALKRWVSWARRCRLAPFKRLGATVRDHLSGILNSFRLGLSNGTAESINAKVQAAIARARGFRTHRHLMTIIYLSCGKLTHLPAPPYTRPISAA